MTENAPSPRFRQWVKRFGIAPLARILGTHRSVVYYWIDADSPTYPRVETARRIIQLSRGELTYNDIFGDTLSPLAVTVPAVNRTTSAGARFAPQPLVQ